MHTYTIDTISKASRPMRNTFRVDIWSDRNDKYGELVATLYRDYRSTAEFSGVHYCKLLDRLEAK